MTKDTGYYTARYRFDIKRASVWKAIVEDIQKRFIVDSSCILDIGCGYGDFINQVNSPQKFALDREDVSKYLDISIEFIKNEINYLSTLKEEMFSTVFCSNLLEHLDLLEGQKLVENIYRLLKPKGRIILLQPNFKLCSKHYFDDYTHRTIYTDESLCGLLQAKQFEIVFRKAGYLPFSMNGILPKSYYLTKLFLLMRSPFMGSQMLVVAEKS